MTGRERNVLLLGIVMGALVVASIFVARHYLLSRQEASAAAAPSTETSVSAPDVPSTTDSAVSVQLSEQEQRQIGVETAEVKRETIRKEIAAPGKVAEPETGIGTISARVGGRI